jgi:peroxiredoxin
MHIGDKLPNFRLLSTSGEYVSNFDFADKYSLLLVVTCNHCKYAQAYWGRLKKLMAQFEEDNLGMAAICGNDAKQYPQDSYENMQQFSKSMHLPFPYLHDPDQNILRTLNASKTPEVFLFNSQRELVYRGAIDDNWENEHAVMTAYLEDAIEYCLDGLEVDYPEIPPVGCTVKWLPGNEPLAQ